MNFNIASASIIGRTHRKLLYNNQDYYKVARKDDCILALVCDGCGSSPHSEAGAILTGEFLSNYCLQEFTTRAFNEEVVRKALYAFYSLVSEASLAGSKTDFVRDTFLTTIIGCLIRKDTTTIFSAGDGVIVVNEAIEVISQQNAPHYIAHSLYKGINYPFQVRTYPSDQIQRILLASDGIEDLWGKHNTAEVVVNSLFASNALFENEINLSKYLVEQVDLLDDTTIILVKR